MDIDKCLLNLNRNTFRNVCLCALFKRLTAKAVFYIQSLPESRRDWMLYRIEFVGKYDNRVNKYWFWQDKSHPIELTTNEMIEQRMNYIHQNPVRAGVVTVAEDYLYSSARNYARLSIVIEIDLIR